MRKLLAALVAVVTLAGAAVATTSPADAYWGGWHGGGWHGGGWHGGGWGWGWGGVAAGAAVGAALAAPYYGGYYGGYPYPYYGYPYPYRPCVWRRWWNGYAWVRGCV